MNRRANYYTPYGSYDGCVKIGGRWLRTSELNKIDKTGWVRWQGPPSPAMVKALREQPPVPATDRFPGLRRFS